MKLTVEVSPGELIDKLTILEIKSSRIKNDNQLANIKTELDIIDATARPILTANDEVNSLTDELRGINSELWDIEDDIRVHESRKDFGETFIKLARAVYFTNDRRAAVKRAINEKLDSHIVEEKSYERYDDDA